MSKSIEFELCDMKLTTFKGFHQVMKFDSDKYIAIIDVTGAIISSYLT